MNRAPRAAAALLEEAWDGHLPVDVEALARHVGAEVVYDAFDEEISGVLCRTKDSAVIGVNAAHAVTRQRFTAAHELGHLLLHRGRAVIVEEDFRVNFRREDSKVTSKQEEVEANSFAASLLIPEESVLEAVRQMVDEDDDDSSAWAPADVAWLARKFKVSPQAMGIRLANLGIRYPGC